MEGYKIYYDRNIKKFTFDKEKSEVINVPFDAGIWWNTQMDTTIEAVNKLNNDVEIGNIEILECKQCNKLFLLNRDEKYWFLAHSLNPPKRCYKCRKNK